MAVTRNIGARFQDIHDEVSRSYPDAIKLTGNEWAAFGAYGLQVGVINRVSARYFYGKKLCSDPEFLKLSNQATMELPRGKRLRMLPVILRPLGAKVLTNMHALRARMDGYLRPIINERLEQKRIYGSEWSGKPNDLISWLMDGARASGEEISTEDMITRVIFTSFAAIHTSSAAMTATLYQMCLNHEDKKEIRDEVEHVVESDGWSKSSLNKMYELDSYMLTVGRVTLKDFVFSDGSFLPKHTTITVNIYSRHNDDNLYPNAKVFDGFRFSKDPIDVVTRPMLATPTLEYHGFGHGRSACPGRFFAVTEMKTMMAHIITNYDIKLEEYPPKMFLEQQSFPNTQAKILFRKRKS